MKVLKELIEVFEKLLGKVAEVYDLKRGTHNSFVSDKGVEFT